MKAPGLTKAMRAALEFVKECEFFPDNVSVTVHDAAIDRAFARMVEPGLYELTPRGHSALSAPAMTRGEYESLRLVEAGWSPSSRAMAVRLHARGWIAGRGVQTSRELTPSGSKALNDMRAAEGSPDWKESP